MKTILFLLALFFIALPSCVTLEKCQQKFGQAKVDTVISFQVDTFAIKERVRDTVLKRLPGEFVIIRDSIPCPDLINKKFTGKSKRGTVEADISIENNKITVNCKADSLIEVLREKDREITLLKTEQTTINKQTAFVDTRKWWQKIPWYWAVPFWLFGVIILILIIKKIFS